MKKNNKKGFTLAELLVVVAIIAVLTAIAIPVFTAAKVKAEEAADIANLRSAYADAVTSHLTENVGYPGAYNSGKFGSLNHSDRYTWSWDSTASKLIVSYKPTRANDGSSWKVEADW